MGLTGLVDYLMTWLTCPSKWVLFYILDQHLVLMLSTVMNGESRQIVKVEIIVHIVTQEPNNSFILR